MAHDLAEARPPWQHRVRATSIQALAHAFVMLGLISREGAEAAITHASRALGLRRAGGSEPAIWPGPAPTTGPCALRGGVPSPGSLARSPSARRGCRRQRLTCAAIGAGRRGLACGFRSREPLRASSRHGARARPLPSCQRSTTSGVRTGCAGTAAAGATDCGRARSSRSRYLRMSGAMMSAGSN
jgi:hypothetical protein